MVTTTKDYLQSLFPPPPADNFPGKALALGRRAIPYSPELRRAFEGDLLQAILFQQLEYWFTYEACGFYKFIEPCNHELYRSGDSWTEELAFSAAEFRRTFDKFGIRYRSLRHLQEALAAQQAAQQPIDPFQGQLYCAIYDTRRGITYFYRNHVRVNAFFQELLLKTPWVNHQIQPWQNGATHSTDPQTTLTALAPLMQPSELTQRTVPNCQNQSSELSKPSVVYKEAKMSKTQKKAASSAPTTAATAAAAFSMEPLIGETLTPAQTAQVQRFAEQLQPQVTAFPTVSALYNELVYELLDDSFLKCEQQFLRKLNAIQKCALNGTWHGSQKTARELAAQQKAWQETKAAEKKPGALSSYQKIQCVEDRRRQLEEQQESVEVWRDRLKWPEVSAEQRAVFLAKQARAQTALIEAQAHFDAAWADLSPAEQMKALTQTLRDIQDRLSDLQTQAKTRQTAIFDDQIVHYQTQHAALHAQLTAIQATF